MRARVGQGHRFRGLCQALLLSMSLAKSSIAQREQLGAPMFPHLCPLLMLLLLLLVILLLFFLRLSVVALARKEEAALAAAAAAALLVVVAVAASVAVALAVDVA